VHAGVAAAGAGRPALRALVGFGEVPVDLAKPCPLGPRALRLLARGDLFPERVCHDGRVAHRASSSARGYSS
jgi:hypothetical protein